MRLVVLLRRLWVKLRDAERGTRYEETLIRGVWRVAFDLNLYIPFIPVNIALDCTDVHRF